MEENQNSSVDLSNYWESTPKKRNVSGKVFKEEQKKKKNKIYIAIIAACLLVIVVLWISYYTQSKPTY